MLDQATISKLLVRQTLLIFVFAQYFCGASNSAMRPEQLSLACPKATDVNKFNWLLHVESKMCYIFFKSHDMMDWNGHRKQCQAMGEGYDLASPDTQSQWDFISKMLNENWKKGMYPILWLGFRTCSVNDAPVVDGSDTWIRDNFCYSNRSTRLMFTKAWHQGEPTERIWNGPELCAYTWMGKHKDVSWASTNCAGKHSYSICAGPALDFLPPIISALQQDNTTLLQKALNISVLQSKIGPVSLGVAEVYMKIIQNSRNVSGKPLNYDIYIIDIMKMIRQMYIDALNLYMQSDDFDGLIIEPILTNPALGLKLGILVPNETAYILQNVRNKYEKTKPCHLQIADLHNAAFDASIPLLMRTFPNGTAIEKQKRAETWFEELQLKTFKKAVADGDKPEIWTMLSNKGLVDARINVRQDFVVYSSPDSDLYDQELVDGLIKEIGISGPQVTLKNAAVFVKGHVLKNLVKTLTAGDKNGTMRILQTPALGLGCLREEHAPYLYEGLQTTMNDLKAKGDNLTLAVFEPRIKQLIRELSVQQTTTETPIDDKNQSLERSLDLDGQGEKSTAGILSPTIAVGLISLVVSVLTVV